jgi:hypothetical protein
LNDSLLNFHCVFLRHRVYILQISMKKTFIASTIYSSWQFKAYWNSQVIQRCYQLNAYSNSWRSDKTFTWNSGFPNSPIKIKVILYGQQSTLQYTSNHSIRTSYNACIFPVHNGCSLDRNFIFWTRFIL